MEENFFQEKIVWVKWKDWEHLQTTMWVIIREKVPLTRMMRKVSARVSVLLQDKDGHQNILSPWKWTSFNSPALLHHWWRGVVEIVLLSQKILQYNSPRSLSATFSMEKDMGNTPKSLHTHKNFLLKSFPLYYFCFCYNFWE